MEIKSEIDMESLKRWYLYANTPYYLYRNFKEDSGIGDLAEKYRSNPKVVLDALDSSLNQDLHIFDNTVEVYALIMVLSFFDTPEVKAFFNQLEKCPIQWAKEIKEYYFDSLPNETFKVVLCSQNNIISKNNAADSFIEVTVESNT